ncbi:MAG: agmatine deiminase family protein [Phycisphaerales bacterium]
MTNTPLRAAALIAASTAALAFAQTQIQSTTHAQPITDGQSLEYPEGAEIPRSMTPAEQAFTELNPIQAVQSRGAAPSGLIRTPGEYEPAEGIILTWEGSNAWKSILAQMTREITTTGEAKAFIFVDSSAELTSASNQVAALGADMSRVQFEIERTDTIWARDFGPRYIFLGSAPDGTGGVRAIVDHTYNRPRPNDNGLPSYWANERNEPYFLIPLVHGGGNYHLETGSPAGIGHATELINNENPGLSESQIIQFWKDYQNLDTTLYDPYPAFVDSTQHIDMWMIILDDDKVMISEWVNEPTASWSITSNNAAADFAARGFEVFRVPAVRSGGTHYTFTNAVICNDLVLVPFYTNSTASQFNDDALAVWEAAYPDKTIVQINCQALVTAAGVMHCIVKHVPAGANGEAPGVYMTSQNDSPVIDPSDSIQTTWLFDAPDGATTADLLLSTDGGATFPTIIGAGFDATTGSFQWNAPDVGTTDARLRLVIRDSDGDESFDDSDLSFTITGNSCIADFTGEGSLNFLDVSAFLEAFGSMNPIADLTGEGSFNFLDVSAFLSAYSAGCP